MRARKRFGQHFLEPAWIDKLVALIDPHGDEFVLEIGAGRGALTMPLASRVRQIRAIEIDRDLAAELALRVPGNVDIITGDVLALELADLVPSPRDAPGRFRVAGNLPFNLSSPILARLLDLSRQRPDMSDATLMLQREVADRLAAPPGNKRYGALTVRVRLYADAERLATLPPGAFRPAPRVESAVVRLTFHPPRVKLGHPGTFDTLVRRLFTLRRKTLLNALRPLADELGRSSAELLSLASIDPQRRPETLEMAEFAELAEVLGPIESPAVL